MGQVILVFGAFIALNMGVGVMVSDYISEDDENQGVVEVQEVAADQTVEASEESMEQPAQ